jgi:hypothetical protein
MAKMLRRKSDDCGSESKWLIQLPVRLDTYLKASFELSVLAKWWGHEVVVRQEIKVVYAIL